MEDSALVRLARGDGTAVHAVMSQFNGLVWSLARKLCPRHDCAKTLEAEWGSMGAFAGAGEDGTQGNVVGAVVFSSGKFGPVVDRHTDHHRLT